MGSLARQDGMFDGVERLGEVEHVAVGVAPGRMTLAMTFFMKCGFEEDKRRLNSGRWKNSRFMTNTDCPVGVQLIETSPDTKLPLAQTHENHVALIVNHAGLAAKTMQQWAVTQGLEATAEEYGERVWYVSIPNLFAAAFEIAERRE